MLLSMTDFEEVVVFWPRFVNWMSYPVLFSLGSGEWNLTERKHLCKIRGLPLPKTLFWQVFRQRFEPLQYKPLYLYGRHGSVGCNDEIVCENWVAEIKFCANNELYFNFYVLKPFFRIYKYAVRKPSCYICFTSCFISVQLILFACFHY